MADQDRGGAAALLTGVLGAPVSHSRSPAIHNAWIRRHGLRGVYAPLHVEPTDLEGFLALAPRLGFRGVNVTVPLKEAAFGAAARVSETARRSGSVNTILFDPVAGPMGDSTDGYGFLANLADRAPGWRPAGATVAIVGAGGAVRAVAAALLDAGAARLRLVNRTRVRTEAVAAALGGAIDVVDWPATPAFFEGADLWVNGTSMGLAGETTDAPWRLPPAVATTIATDMVYAPLDTPFLQAARAVGATTVDGLGMLLHQARPGFRAWHGVDPSVDDEIRRIALGSVGCVP